MSCVFAGGGETAGVRREEAPETHTGSAANEHRGPADGRQAKDRRIRFGTGRCNCVLFVCCNGGGNLGSGEKSFIQRGPAEAARVGSTVPACREPASGQGAALCGDRQGAEQRLLQGNCHDCSCLKCYFT